MIINNFMRDVIYRLIFEDPSTQSPFKGLNRFLENLASKLPGEVELNNYYVTAKKSHAFIFMAGNGDSVFTLLLKPIGNKKYILSIVKIHASSNSEKAKQKNWRYTGGQWYEFYFPNVKPQMVDLKSVLNWIKSNLYSVATELQSKHKELEMA